ncbi:acyl carrier protein [Nocardia grenadensis]|uniref:acyl carrier protein n=1 Tax=Nocardia grenadensis TaxID=931537 RepID=UPI003D8B7672
MEADPTTLTVRVRQHLARVLGTAIGPEDMDTRITQLPRIDSLKIVEVIVAVESDLGIRLDEDDLFEVRTLTDLCRLIQHVAAEQNAGKPD